MAIIRWAPRKSFFDVADEFNKMWEENLQGRWADRERMWQPRVDIKDGQDAIQVTAEVPGLTQKDISISIRENHLIISGEKKSEMEHEDDSYHCCERRYGKFERAFVLPSEVDAEKAEAKVKDGILSVKLPKVEKVKAKEIKIKAE